MARLEFLETHWLPSQLLFVHKKPEMPNNDNQDNMRYEIKRSRGNGGASDTIDPHHIKYELNTHGVIQIVCPLSFPLLWLQWVTPSSLLSFCFVSCICCCSRWQAFLHHGSSSWWYMEDWRHVSKQIFHSTCVCWILFYSATISKQTLISYNWDCTNMISL